MEVQHDHITHIQKEKSRKKNVFNMLKEEYDELEDIFFILQKLVPYSMNTKSLLLKKSLLLNKTKTSGKYHWKYLT